MNVLDKRNQVIKELNLGSIIDDCGGLIYDYF